MGLGDGIGPWHTHRGSSHPLVAKGAGEGWSDMLLEGEGSVLGQDVMLLSSPFHMDISVGRCPSATRGAQEAVTRDVHAGG